MAEVEINEQKFADGFNRGYWLYAYEPEVAKSLMQSEIDTRDDFSTGFSQGLLQADQEKTIDEFDQIRDASSEPDLDIER
jgi:hypothetical protein